MTTLELLDYLSQNVATFASLSIEPPGVGYHYTQYAAEIQRNDRFLGAAINATLAATQRAIHSTPATEPGGVVFAYFRLETACEMAPDCTIASLGPRCDVFRLFYRSAVSVEHVNDGAAEGRGVRQLLILADQIRRYELLGHARDLQDLNRS